ncbi:uncharacterized protein L969DRAFT_49023 [Mixia osmundae IAM 14324]|uniref:uncharacterized protein n=1 Tax=Mixia osmundae (strain CBS 9802 / IAM 14324 / JCM 22182 / KY 12970) TaxID=764103 RepID=UPI0004A548C9|nr:uncharacterized protein L969DRAFT_49023 [Mixia osmundae IAM 14324]KEI39175.1 hypothetical protein L969DRAFT_49023 [Mixia osmundae IAM 14324]
MALQSSPKRLAGKVLSHSTQITPSLATCASSLAAVAGRPRWHAQQAESRAIQTEQAGSVALGALEQSFDTSRSVEYISTWHPGKHARADSSGTRSDTSVELLSALHLPRQPVCRPAADPRRSYATSSTTSANAMADSETIAPILVTDTARPAQRPRWPFRFPVAAHAKPAAPLERQTFEPAAAAKPRAKDRTKDSELRAKARAYQIKRKAVLAERDATLKQKWPAFALDSIEWRKPLVRLCKTPAELTAALQDLEPLGMDLEWNVSKRKAQTNKVSLVQICDARQIIIYQIPPGQAGVPQVLRALLEDAAVWKIGVNIGNDGKKLEKDHDVDCKGLLELTKAARLVDAPTLEKKRAIVSLQELSGIYLEKYLPKGEVRTSDWERPLTSEQVNYAAHDVFAGLQIFRRLLDLGGQPLESFAVCLTDFVAPKATTLPRSKTASPRKAAGIAISKATPRQLEAWELWHEQDEEPEAIAISMSIQPTTVVSYIMEGMRRQLDLQPHPDRLEMLLHKQPVIRHQYSKLIQQIASGAERTLIAAEELVPYAIARAELEDAKDGRGEEHAQV